MKILVTILLSIFSTSITIAQYDYEPTATHPFGQPHPDAPQQLKDFEPMIGVCDCKSTSRTPDGSWSDAVDMRWTFKYIMNGMAVQDETLKADGKHSGSIRQFIADSSKWYVHYYSSNAPSVVLPTWEGKKKDGAIVLYRDQKSPNGIDGFYRLTFYDMSKTGYKWIGEWVSKDESIEYPTWKIDCARKI